MNITKNFVDKLKLPSAGMTQKNYYDDNLKGFGIRITINGIKSFIIEKRINTIVYKTTLGRYPVLSVENARKKAQDFLGKIAMGVCPTEEKLDDKINTITLQSAFTDFLTARKNLKLNTISSYTRIIRKELASWQNKSLAGITKEMITKKHAEIGIASKAQANLTMRLLRAIFTFAVGSYSTVALQENPVKILSYTRSWYNIAKRNTVITPAELPTWYDVVKKLPFNEADNNSNVDSKAAIVKDYLLLVLFTGLRRQEAARLKWSDIDFNNKKLTVADTKNHLNHNLPLSNFLFELLQSRYNANATNSKFVFTGNSKAGYLVEPQEQIKTIVKMSGITFTIHDLRRIFITVAESIDIPAYTLKRLLNHKSQDITNSYICIEIERLRKPMQLITNKILSLTNTFNIDSPIVLVRSV